MKTLRLLVLSSIVLMAFPGICLAEESMGQLTRASEIRTMKAAEAKAHRTIRLRGVVLFPPHQKISSFVIADETAAVYCEPMAGRRVSLNRGDQVEILGHTELRGFAPFVVTDRVTPLGKGEIPAPSPVTFDQLASGAFDSQSVEVTGIVRRSEKPENQANEWLIELAIGGSRLKVLFRDLNSAQQAVDAEIRVNGICFYQFGQSGQIIHPVLIVPSGIRCEVVKHPPEEVPARPFDRLMSFASESYFGHRVLVRGVVTHHVPGECFWMQENGRGLRVIQTEESRLLRGQSIEVIGFPVQGNYSPEMEDVVVQGISMGTPPAPIDLESSVEALRHDAGLIRIKATLIEQMRVPLGLRLILRDNFGDFPAQLRLDLASNTSPHWQIGSEVDITGICQVSQPPAGTAPGTLIPRDFELILRTPSDLTVLEAPPWWNAERLLAATTAALVIGVGLVIWMARRRLNQSAIARRQSEAEFSAILSERNRIAREIHDTLAQGLGAISLHLELVKGQIPSDSDAATHLAEASSLTRVSLGEARNSIWNMRSQILEEFDLAGALAGVLDQLTEIDGIEGRFEATGDRFRLPPLIENHLLRIGQEAIANAVKHASAKRISVTVSFLPTCVTIRVKDDGRGFDPENDGADEGHFGLTGLRERAAELGATLRFESARNRGTEVILEMPVLSIASQ